MPPRGRRRRTARWLHGWARHQAKAPAARGRARGSGVTMATPILWHFPISHFNEKVRWALDWKGIPHVRRTLGPDYLPRVWWATGRGTLPVLWLDGKAIGDSTRIIEALERRWPEPPLYPRDESVRRRALGRSSRRFAPSIASATGSTPRRSRPDARRWPRRSIASRPSSGRAATSPATPSAWPT
ncbi:MAG: hypothetical protein E6J69_03175 [Deltaproteobacteria bacterium]|nr:MAG: hypothetical protein E6J69_03175 [Deltaproteobacteria bacterium]